MEDSIMSKERSLFCAVNRKEDEAESGLKEKHVPVLHVPDTVEAGKAFDVKIDCWGDGKHPNEHGHFIQWVELYAGEVFLSRVEFTAVVTQPVATVPVTVYHPGEATLRAISRCNLHGLWEGSVTVTAKEA